MKNEELGDIDGATITRRSNRSAEEIRPWSRLQLDFIGFNVVLEGLLRAFEKANWRESRSRFVNVEIILLVPLCLFLYLFSSGL